MWLAMLGSVIAGVLIATQSYVNGRLGAELGTAIIAAWISFTGGLLVIAVVAVFAPKARSGLRDLRAGLRARSVPWWIVFGGAAGAFFVTSQSLSVGALGVSLFTLGVVAGQVSSSFVFDSHGLSPSGSRRVTAFRVGGALLTIVAMVLALSARVEAATSLWLIVAPVIAGVFIAWQSGVNGRINQATSSGIATSVVNFTTGTIALSLAALVWVLTNGLPTTWPTEPWLYLGGLLGLVFIAYSSLFVRVIGILLLALANIAGQLLASFLFDLLVPVSSEPVTATLVVGLVLAFLGVLVAGWRELKRD